MFDPNFADEPEYLPTWQRVLLATALPLAVAGLGVAVWLIVLLQPVGGFEPAAGADWSSMLHNAATSVPLFITAPFVAVLVGMAWTVKWKTWQTAVAGGLLRLLIAIACGAGVVGALFALS